LKGRRLGSAYLKGAAFVVVGASFAWRALG
jgi:hypothetical protein